jgi:hypothetical protein
VDELTNEQTDNSLVLQKGKGFTNATVATYKNIQAVVGKMLSATIFDEARAPSHLIDKFYSPAPKGKK